MSEWISTDEKLPEEDKHVLLRIILQNNYGLSMETEIMVTGGIKGGDWFVGNTMLIWDYDYNLDFTSDDVTHWMPLPEPPKGE